MVVGVGVGVRVTVGDGEVVGRGLAVGATVGVEVGVDYKKGETPNILRPTSPALKRQPFASGLLVLHNPVQQGLHRH